MPRGDLVAWLTAALFVVAPLPLLADSNSGAESEGTSETEGDVRAKITGELGFVDPLVHKVQFSKNGTYFDYVEEGGQDTLFNFQRISAEFTFNDNHELIFLYQPLAIRTQVRLPRDVTVDELTFPEGTPMNLTYKFPFYRASYLYDFWEESDREIAIGASLQLRNATISFASQDGEDFRSNRDVGPVPIIKFRTRVPFGERFWFGFEADGFYAPVRYLNGGDSDVTGAILDASLRLGRSFGDHFGGFVNLRYLGGGGEGTNDDDVAGPGDGYTRNWLHFATVSLGFSYALPIAGAD